MYNQEEKRPLPYFNSHFSNSTCVFGANPCVTIQYTNSQSARKIHSEE